jgi:NADPH2:quinone reductase
MTLFLKDVSMKACWYEKTGPARKVLQFGDIETPDAKEGEARIKIYASGINPADVKLRSGVSTYGYNFPFVIPNSDGAGVIDQVGKGVTEELLESRVWFFNGQRLGRAYGSGAEFIALDKKYITPLPENIPFDEGATLGIPAMTAYHSIFSDGPVAGKTVLVTGGSGAVGFYCVSLASWGGARVLATVSSVEKGENAILGGATDIINYKTEDVAQRIEKLTNGAGVDRVISVDFADSLPWLPKVIRKNGCVVAYASDTNRSPQIDFFAFMRNNIQIRPFILNALPQKHLDDARFGINKWLNESPNALRPVAANLPLSRMIEAHELVESGSKFGTVIVSP